MRNKSPSVDMRRLSKTLMSQSSTYAELPPGTLTDGPSTLAEASYLEERSNRTRQVSDPKASFSEDDTVSTFSCAGDLLPDEAPHSAQLFETSGTDSDFVAIKRIAQVLARRRHVDADMIIPKLLDMFDAQSLGIPRSSPTVISPARMKSAVSITQAISAPPTRKNTKLMAKASGFFHKLKPQLNIDTALDLRRFSFEAGDDSTMSAPGLSEAQRAVSSSALASTGTSERVLRKSASTPLLAEHAARPSADAQQRALSPVQHSPTNSTPVSESRRASKIPTPTYGNGTLARPRQERESSESSLLTAIRYSETVDRRSSSLSSSGYSSPPAGRMDSTLVSQATASNRLLEHTQALRGNAPALTASANFTEDMAEDPGSVTVHDKRQTVQTSSPDERHKENARPMNWPESHLDQQQLH